MGLGTDLQFTGNKELRRQLLLVRDLNSKTEQEEDRLKYRSDGRVIRHRWNTLRRTDNQPGTQRQEAKLHTTHKEGYLYDLLFYYHKFYCLLLLSRVNQTNTCVFSVVCLALLSPGGRAASRGESDDGEQPADPEQRAGDQEQRGYIQCYFCYLTDVLIAPSLCLLL